MIQNCRVTCLVDNCVALSSALWGEHGLSFLVEAGESLILFDTGQSGAVLQHNLEALKLDGRRVRAIVLSHGHYDHTGGLLAALAWAQAAEIVAHPQIFARRFSRRTADGKTQLKEIGFPFDREEIARTRRWQLHGELAEIAPDIWITGQIPRVRGQGTTEPRLVVKTAEGLRPDPFLDDQSLILDTAKGLVLVLGCCHTGLLNTVEHARRSLRKPIYAILGGSHLGPEKAERVHEIARILGEDYAVQALYLNHCTGQAVVPLREVLGERVHPCPAGTVVEC